jgi:hypothetical protein
VPDIALEGMWQFKTGDSERWKDPQFDDHTWNKIFVPAFWETQGYAHYDGFTWYRLHCKIPAELADKTLILMLGRIDDLDETYVNGEMVGRTGRMYDNPRRNHLDGEYQVMRAYTIPSGVLKGGAENVIAVRVFDGEGPGGIYQGPIGIVTREQYKKWKRNRPWKERVQENSKNIFDMLFE